MLPTVQIDELEAVREVEMILMHHPTPFPQPISGYEKKLLVQVTPSKAL